MSRKKPGKAKRERKKRWGARKHANPVEHSPLTFADIVARHPGIQLVKALVDGAGKIMSFAQRQRLDHLEATLSRVRRICMDESAETRDRDRIVKILQTLDAAGLTPPPESGVSSDTSVETVRAPALVVADDGTVIGRAPEVRYCEMCRDGRVCEACLPPPAAP